MGEAAARDILETVRLMEAADMEDALRLLSSLRVSFAGVESAGLARAICREAVTRRDPVAFVAVAQGELAGLVLCARRQRFWQHFLAWHPLLGMEVILRRARPHGKSDSASGKEHHRAVDSLPPRPAPYSWTDSSPDTARILFIGVAGKFRRLGIAARLYRGLFHDLARRGDRRVLACIGYDNAGSVKMHEAAGWQLYREPAHWLAVRELSQEDATSVAVPSDSR